MQSHKLCIFIAAIIAVGLKGSLALNCAITGGTDTACADGVAACYIKTETNGTVTRGCNVDTASCTTPNCLTCTTDKCNAYLMCKQCDGSQSECSTTNAAADSFNQLCSAANQVCLNQVNTNGSVTRGCATGCTEGQANCNTCDKDICNIGIYPENRLQCYQCTGNSCNAVTQTMLTPCQSFETEGQQCYTIGTSDTDMQRGCNTDAGAKCAVGSTDANCAFCNNETGCNNRTFSGVLNNCYKCNDNEACVLAQTGQAVACPASNYTQSEVGCYWQMTAEGTVQRGCTNELPNSVCNATENCNACNTTACNIGAAAFTCLICRSDNYAPCRQAAVGPETCQNQPSSNTDTTKCFSGEWDGVVIRGCLGDLGQLMKFQCENDADDRCVICDGLNCNTEVDKYNGAAALQSMGLALLGLIFLVRMSL